MAKKVNITQVAKAAGVSTATVSHYLNGHFSKMSEETRQRIARTIEETGYVPSASARWLSGKSSGVIAVLICNIANDWAGHVFRGMEKVAQENGYQIIVCNTSFDEKSEMLCVEKMLSLGIDGFVIQPAGQVRTLRERLRKADKPVVFYDYSPFDLDGYWVKANLYDAFYTAVTGCVDRGYEDFVVLAADVKGMRTRLERLQGIEDALSARGITPTMLNVSHDSPSVRELSHYFQYELNPSKRTMIICPHQWLLPNVYRALKPAQQLVPQRIGLLGIDNEDWTELVEPSLSTVVQPVKREGEIAFEMISSLLQGKEPETPHQVLSCDVRWLDSCREADE